MVVRTSHGKRDKDIQPSGHSETRDLESAKSTCVSDVKSHKLPKPFVGKLPQHKVLFANINFGSISDQWKQKPGDPINPAEPVICVK